MLKRAKEGFCGKGGMRGLEGVLSGTQQFANKKWKADGWVRRLPSEQ